MLGTISFLIEETSLVAPFFMWQFPSKTSETLHI